MSVPEVPEVNRKSDGHGGPPLIAPVATPTPGKPNAAMTEPRLATDTHVDPNHRFAAHLTVIDAQRGIVGTADGSPRRKKIAICGFASSTRPYIIQMCEDPTWEIWGLNQLYRHIPRADMWFDIHYNWDQEVVPGTDHRKWARECGIPFYMYAKQPDVPTSLNFPLKAVIGVYQADYFTSTIPYMLTLALMEIDAAVQAQTQQFFRDMKAAGDVDKLLDPDFHIQDVIRGFYAEYTIGIFGIDLVVGGEYFQEKPCAEFWVGAAAVGRGISMAIPKESALCKQLYRYGFDPEPNQLITSKEIRNHLAEVTAERDEQLKKLYMLEGVMQAEERHAQIIELRQRGAQV